VTAIQMLWGWDLQYEFGRCSPPTVLKTCRPIRREQEAGSLLLHLLNQSEENKKLWKLHNRQPSFSTLSSVVSKQS